MGAQLFHADGRMDEQTDTDRDRQIDIDNTKLIVEFRNEPKIALPQNRA